MEMHRILAEPKIDPQKLSDYLDGLENTARIAEVATMTAREQSRLFEAARGFHPVNLDFYAPASGRPLAEVIHHGRNSLPLFTRFQKRFCRPDRATGEEQRWGYNHQPMAFFTGPGYFVARQSDDREVVIDYYQVPPA